VLPRARVCPPAYLNQPSTAAPILRHATADPSVCAFISHFSGADSAGSGAQVCAIKHPNNSGQDLVGRRPPAGCPDHDPQKREFSISGDCAGRRPPVINDAHEKRDRPMGLSGRRQIEICFQCSTVLNRRS
jgi:hypothetical protein